MKKVLLTTLLSLAAMLAVPTANAAEPIEFGIRAGIQTQNLGNFKKINISGSGITGLSADNSFGFQVGLMSRINIIGFFIQPEVVYSFNSYKMHLNETSNTKIKVSDFQIPVLVGTKFAFLDVFAGPVFNLVSETKNSNSSNIVTDITKSAVGYQLGAGLRLFQGLHFDIRYGGNFTRSEQTITVGSNTGTMKTSSNGWVLNVGYFF